MMHLSMWIFTVLWISSSSATSARPGECPPTPKSKNKCYNIVSGGCKDDSDCPGVQRCCPNTCAANSCKDARQVEPYPVPDDKCPSYRNDVKCKRYSKKCHSNIDCPKSQVCCTVKCGRECRPPKPDNCPLVKCNGLPPGVCSRDTYKYIGGRMCKMCPEVIPCTNDPCANSPRCFLPPPGICSEPIYRIIDRVKCQWCYKIVPCKPPAPDHCPQINCMPLPKSACSEPTFKIIKGTKCYFCDKEIPCSKACRQPKQPGPCKGAIQRYYFDIRSKSCRRFIYGGCGGNGNRFSTLAECELKCKKYGY